LSRLQTSASIYSPSGVSSFFEICDTNRDGTKNKNPLQIGARGGGFIIEKGNITRATYGNSIRKDSVFINRKASPEARTSLKVIELMRKEFDLPPVRIDHRVLPPIGSGFGTSGAGAVGTALALNDLFELHLTLSKAASFAHISEIQSVTGLGTVISLTSGNGAIGLVTEPGSYGIGKVDSIPVDYDDYTLICACFGPIEKSSVLSEPKRRLKVNKYGKRTLEAILDEPTPSSLLFHSRRFAEDSGIGSKDLLKLADTAIKCGAEGATQNMIGNAIHCLVERNRRKSFLSHFETRVHKNDLFETNLVQSGPRFI
jgi:pantoate kinase